MNWVITAHIDGSLLPGQSRVPKTVSVDHGERLHPGEQPPFENVTLCIDALMFS